jgi:hypothetical protein
MSENIISVATQNTLLPTNIVYDPPEITADKKYIVSKMWLHQQNSTKSLLFQTPLSNVIRLTSKGFFIFSINERCNTLFEQIDANTVKYIQSSNMTNKFNIKNGIYNSIVEEYNNNGDNINVLNISLEGKPIKYYLSDGVTPVEENNAKKMLSCKGTKIRTILEFDGIIVDLKTNIITTNVKIRQIQITYNKPEKIELVSYSFVGSEEEPEQVKKYTKKRGRKNITSEKPEETLYSMLNLKKDLQSNTSCNNEGDDNERLDVIANSDLDEIFV